MRIHLIVSALICSFCTLFTPVLGADQTDARLDPLFDQLKNSSSAFAQREAENAIWQIWHDSGSEDIEKLMGEAGTAVSAGELKAAEEIYTTVIERAPDFSEGWNRRATVRYYMRNFDGSLDDIEQTLRLEPRHFGAIWGLGMILGLQKNYQEAIAAFEKLLEIKPNAHDARPRIDLLRQELAKGAV